MRTPKPLALTAKEQAERHEERFQTEVDDVYKRMSAAARDADSYFDRLTRRAADLGITPVDAILELQPLLQIQRSLKAGVERVVVELDLISIERYLAKTDTGSSRREDLRTRRDVRRAQLKLVENKPPAPMAGGLPPAVQKALETLSRNAAVKGPPQREHRMVELQEMQIIFEDGLRELFPLIEEMKSAAGFDEAKKLQARHRKLHLELFRIEQAYSEKSAEERALREAFTHCGYSRSDLLPAPVTLNITLMLGSEDTWESSISQHRRSLENRKIL
jgi:hypothetical protein